MRTLTVTEAVRNFSDVIGRVRYAGEVTTLTKGDKPIARIVPVKPVRTTADFLAWANDPDRPRLAPEELAAFERDIETARKHANQPPVSKWE
ncbi:type II toxin-antitoxin system Phd/YefM family antitoxin [Ereboglobus luteus]|uniref:Antitoxin n=1 Tax=Ereboglobus luteus TaxID=1796921 RepID=A0A2U8E682_9BACT|nr:type II toxin-antitoxin system prevent-host-death family antitoxin [Ereboglobus luteus]AWI10336.1 hypothetical protein CKA38_14680 [Ereboglobus luteus]